MAIVLACPVLLGGRLSRRRHHQVHPSYRAAQKDYWRDMKFCCRHYNDTRSARAYALQASVSPSVEYCDSQEKDCSLKMIKMQRKCGSTAEFYPFGACVTSWKPSKDSNADRLYDGERVRRDTY